MNTSMKYALGLFSGIGIVFLSISCQAGQPKATGQPVTEKTTKKTPTAVKNDTIRTTVNKNNKIIVYYFHGTMRCPTCHMLETLTKTEVETAFSDAIKKGNLEWKMVNTEEKGNEHFEADYNLYTKSVIISKVKDGKELSWKNLDKIWQLVHEEEKYRQYIRGEVQACLGGKCL